MSWKTIDLMAALGQTIGKAREAGRLKESEEGAKHFLMEKLGLSPITEQETELAKGYKELTPEEREALNKKYDIRAKKFDLAERAMAPEEKEKMRGLVKQKGDLEQYEKMTLSDLLGIVPKPDKQTAVDYYYHGLAGGGSGASNKLRLFDLYGRARDRKIDIQDYISTLDKKDPEYQTKLNQKNYELKQQNVMLDEIRKIGAELGIKFKE